jgi:ABC-2 type transport system permease protein
VSPRLFWSITTMQARKMMSYRADFWISALFGFAIQMGVVYFLWDAMFRESGQERIGGYAFRPMLMYYVMVLLIGKVVNVRMGDGMVAADIYDGGLSRYIVYPTNYFLFKFAQRLGDLVPALVQITVFGTLCALLFRTPELEIDAAGMLMGAVSLFAATTLMFALTIPLETVAFWADNVWSLNVMLRFAVQLFGGMMMPMTLYPEWARAPLHWLPFRYVFDVPVNVILGRIGFGEWLLGLVVCAGWLAIVSAITALLWRRGSRAYTGVGM